MLSTTELRRAKDCNMLEPSGRRLFSLLITMGTGMVCLLVGCLTSHQYASVSRNGSAQTILRAATLRQKLQIELSIRSKYTDTDQTSPSTDTITPGAWQGSHWSANFFSHWYDSTPEKKNPGGSGIRTRDLPLSRRKP